MAGIGRIEDGPKYQSDLSGKVLWVIDNIKDAGAYAKRIGLVSPIAAGIAIEAAQHSIKQLKDFVVTTPNAGEALAAAVVTVADEDQAAIIACLLADGLIETVDPENKNSVRTVLEGALDEYQGTGTKMAISWALYKLGHKEPWQALLYGGYIENTKALIIKEKFIEKNMPDKNPEEVKDILCREYADPGSTGITLNLVPDKRGILELVAMDISSDGRLVQRFCPNWVHND